MSREAFDYIFDKKIEAIVKNGDKILDNRIDSIDVVSCLPRRFGLEYGQVAKYEYSNRKIILIATSVGNVLLFVRQGENVVRADLPGALCRILPTIWDDNDINNMLYGFEEGPCMLEQKLQTICDVVNDVRSK